MSIKEEKSTLPLKKNAIGQWLPGDQKPRQIIEQMLRVDHAGEYGATVIYQGQITWFKLSKELREFLASDYQNISIETLISSLNHMLKQEKVHLEYFVSKIFDYQFRPTALQPFWEITGFLLGFLSAALGKRAAMACTVAIEEVIASHYSKQIQLLKKFEASYPNSADLMETKSTTNRKKSNHITHDQFLNKQKYNFLAVNFNIQELAKTIEKFRDEELEHKDIALENEAKKMVFYPLFNFLVKLITKTAIAVAKKI